MPEMDTRLAAYLDWCAQEADGETPPMSYEAWRGWIERRRREPEKRPKPRAKLRVVGGRDDEI